MAHTIGLISSLSAGYWVLDMTIEPTLGFTMREGF